MKNPSEGGRYFAEAPGKKAQRIEHTAERDKEPKLSASEKAAAEVFKKYEAGSGKKMGQDDGKSSNDTTERGK